MSFSHLLFSVGLLLLAVCASPAQAREVVPTAQTTEPAPPPPGQRTYRLGNGIALAGAGIGGIGIVAGLTLNGTCLANEGRPCSALANIYVFAPTLIPAAALATIGSPLSFYGARNMGARPWPVPHYLMLAGAGTAAVGWLTRSPGSVLPDTMWYGGMLVMAGGAITQLAGNVIAVSKLDRDITVMAMPTVVSGVGPGVRLTATF